MADDLEFLPPSIDPAQRASIYGTVKFIINKMVKQDMDHMLPCRVVAVSERSKNRVTVEIMVSMVNTARQVVKRAQVASIPIYQPSAGGFLINLPVAEGDLGWVKATDTDISLFLQTLLSAPSPQPPNTFITHKFDSAVFWPDNMGHGAVFDGDDDGKLVIQNNAGTSKIVMDDTTIAITSTNLTHNGKNIGDTHEHLNGGGTGNSGPPA